MIQLYIPLIIGFIFSTIGIGTLFYLNSRNKKYTESAKASIVEIKKTTGTEGRIYYYPVVEFYSNVEYVRKIHPYGINPCNYHIGEKVIVKYHKNDTSKFYIEGEKTLKLLGICFTITGLFSFTLLFFFTKFY